MKIEPGPTTLKNNIKALKEIARSLGKRTAAIDLPDPQVSRSPGQAQAGTTALPSPTENFSRKISYLANGHQLVVRVNDDYLVLEARGLFGGSVVCSFTATNVREKGMKLAPFSLCQAFCCKVFIGTGSEAKDTIPTLENPYIQELVCSLALAKDESLHISHGSASLYLQHFDRDEALKALDALNRIVTLLPSAGQAPPRFEDLPQGFHKLIPLIKVWGISEDHERTKKIALADPDTLAQLVRAVEPEFNAIDHYLGSFEGIPFNEEALLLGCLAQCAAEAKNFLEKGSQSGAAEPHGEP